MSGRPLPRSENASRVASRVVVVIDLKVIGPADRVENKPFAENAFLWCAEAKPLPPASPTEDNVQEIVIYEGTDDEQRLVFDTSESELDERVAGVCNSLFVTSGTAGVGKFSRAIVEYAELVMPIPTRPQDAQGEKFYINAISTPRREALRECVEAWYDKFQRYEEKVLPKVETAAAAFATVKLERSLDDVLRQSLRYFQNVGPRGDTSSGALVSPSSVLSGPDVPDLAIAMQRVAALRGEVKRFAQAVNRNIGLVDSRTGLIGPELLHAGARRDLRALLGTSLDPDAIVQATRGLQGASQLFAKECAELCRIHPILYRLLDRPIIYQVDSLLRNTPATDAQRALQTFAPLRNILSSTLNETTNAANSLIEELRSDAEQVWKYERAIQGGLSDLHLSEGDIAWQVAMEHLDKKKNETGPLGQLSDGLGAIEFISSLAAVPPPVLIVIAALGVVASVASTIEKALNEAAKDRALSASLNPDDSLVVEGGSYFGVIFNALFILLSIRGVAKDLTKAARL
jgi:hypothetical protein